MAMEVSWPTHGLEATSTLMILRTTKASKSPRGQKNHPPISTSSKCVVFTPHDACIISIDDLDLDSPFDLQVAVHEIGHVLGLIHVNNETSIMFPIYQNREDEFEINREDRRAVQQLYGVCKGRFDVVMDWVRKKYSPGNFIPAYKYNSFFFRGDSYWLYENPENRPRYGDPLEVVSHWTGVPPYLDGYTQIFTDGLFEYEITTLFFKGESLAPVGFN